MRKYWAFWFAFLSGTFLPARGFAGDVDYRSDNQLSPSDYLMGSHGKVKDPVFDKDRTIHLNVDIGIGSDCGRIDIKHTLNAALKNILDTKYFANIGRDIMAASPMLLTCYYSPTWCAILKHARLQANFLASLRLDQCQAVNRFVDQRVTDYSKSAQNVFRARLRRRMGILKRRWIAAKTITTLT